MTGQVLGHYRVLEQIGTGAGRTARTRRSPQTRPSIANEPMCRPRSNRSSIVVCRRNRRSAFNRCVIWPSLWRPYRGLVGKFGVCTTRLCGVGFERYLGALTLAAVVAAGWFLRAWFRPSNEIPGYRRLTYELGTVYAARFAPDGRSVIYEAAWNDQPARLFSTVSTSAEEPTIAQGDSAVQCAAGFLFRNFYLAAIAPTSDWNTLKPSVPPSSGSAARSGWGIIPRTLPPGLQIPAMFSSDPLGLASEVIWPSSVE
jgi:hypothetical protein